ncbi:MAG: alpha-glucosidase [Candidatus Lokiarchaeota archaeon]|nr:alpha-glucosidase [Candidatus Lokiarchaeota archaeon]
MGKKEKIVLIGAGSLQFGLGTVGSILASEVLRGATVCLHDINKEALDLVIKACAAAVEERKLDFALESTLDRAEALQGATFIVNSIEVTPRFKLMDMDYRVPLQFGNKQVTGENGGPGGLLHSIRVIPPILDICADVARICPDAFFINFSNPMSRICLAIKRKFPSLRFAGLCHEYEHFLPYVEKITGKPRQELDIVSGGLNHFGVILEIKDKASGEDMYPKIRKDGPGFLRSLAAYDGLALNAFVLESFGYMPYTPDSHFGEYVQWAWERADIPAIRRFMRTYEEVLMADFKKLTRRIEKGKGASCVVPDEERAVPIIEGIVTDKNYVEPSVNVPNKGVYANLPEDLVVECPAVVNRQGVNGVAYGEYPKGLAALLRAQASVQDLVVEAILQRSKSIALQALLVDPVIETSWQAKQILDEMLELQKDYIKIQLT